MNKIIPSRPHFLTANPANSLLSPLLALAAMYKALMPFGPVDFLKPANNILKRAGYPNRLQIDTAKG